MLLTNRYLAGRSQDLDLELCSNIRELNGSVRKFPTHQSKPGPGLRQVGPVGKSAILPLPLNGSRPFVDPKRLQRVLRDVKHNPGTGVDQIRCKVTASAKRVSSRGGKELVSKPERLQRTTIACASHQKLLHSSVNGVNSLLWGFSVAPQAQAAQVLQDSLAAERYWKRVVDIQGEQLAPGVLGARGIHCLDAS